MQSPKSRLLQLALMALVLLLSGLRQGEKAGHNDALVIISGSDKKKSDDIIAQETKRSCGVGYLMVRRRMPAEKKINEICKYR